MLVSKICCHYDDLLWFMSNEKKGIDFTEFDAKLEKLVLTIKNKSLEREKRIQEEYEKEYVKKEYEKEYDAKNEYENGYEKEYERYEKNDKNINKATGASDKKKVRRIKKLDVEKIRQAIMRAQTLAKEQQEFEKKKKTKSSKISCKKTNKNKKSKK